MRWELPGLCLDLRVRPPAVAKRSKASHPCIHSVFSGMVPSQKNVLAHWRPNGKKRNIAFTTLPWGIYCKETHRSHNQITEIISTLTRPPICKYVGEQLAYQKVCANRAIVQCMFLKKYVENLSCRIRCWRGCLLWCRPTMYTSVGATLTELSID